MHKGKVITKKGKYKLIDCDICKFKHIYPIPTLEEISNFYREKYFKLIKKGDRAPEICRQMAGGKESKFEIEWLRNTLYKDILYIFEKNVRKKPKLLLDIGSGTGVFLDYMKNAGWEVVGIEPSEEGTLVSTKSELNVYNTSLEDFIVKYPKYEFKFDAITLINVLEHVPNAVDFLKLSKKLLKKNSGIICIRVPNDFNKLQKIAEKKIKKSLWWVAIPDHINYFNIESLQELLESLNFKILYSTADFPMEFFLLMNDDYVKNPEVGGNCHKRRVSFELSLPDDIRREIYRKLSEIGIGRDCLVFAKVK